jgi:hypothetical protein
MSARRYLLNPGENRPAELAAAIIVPVNCLRDNLA